MTHQVNQGTSRISKLQDKEKIWKRSKDSMPEGITGM